LRKSHAQKLIPARKRFDPVIAAKTRHAPAELLRMDQFGNLRNAPLSNDDYRLNYSGRAILGFDLARGCTNYAGNKPRA
jgi:hypothetical protein